jgi:hypothetical protein
MVDDNTQTPSVAELGLAAKKTARYLGALGLVPMLALAALAALATSNAPPDWMRVALVSYAMLILAFMAGTLWARLIYRPPTAGDGRAQLLTSNALVLAAWPAIAMAAPGASLWLGLLFAVHLGFDQPWRSQSGPGWYRHMRLWVSAVVIASLIGGGLIGLGVDLWASTSP